MPTKEEVLLGRIPKSRHYSTGSSACKNTAADTDVELYSLHYFVKLACDGQTVALDMLHAPAEAILESSTIWDTIVRNREKFYTKNIQSFVDYARRQASRYGIKGSRLNATAQVLDILKRENPEQKIRVVWEQLPRTEHCFDREPDANGMRQFQVCGKTFQESASIGYVIPILQKYYDEYGRRAQSASENKNIDWKAVSHALRAAYQVREILTEGTITFPLRAADFLRQVKQGALDYISEVAPVLEGLMDEVETLACTSSLPEKVDRAFWERFICETLERELFAH